MPALRLATNSDLLQVRGQGLQCNHCREDVEIVPVDSAIHYAVAQHSSHDQHVERRIEEVVMTNVMKSDECGLHELATGQENQTAMILSLPNTCRCRRRLPLRLQEAHRRTSGVPSQANVLSPIGNERNRFRVAAKMALPMAGASGGTPGSPIPDGHSCEPTICTSTSGISRMRVGS